MSTTLMIILGLLGITVTGYFFAQLANAFNPPSRRPYRNLQHPQGFAPNTVMYQPSLPEEEPQEAIVPFWPVMALMAIAAIFYLANTPVPAGKNSGQPARGTSSVTSAYDSSRFDYAPSTGRAYYGAKEKGPVKRYPVPLSTPRTRKAPAQVEKQAVPYPDPYETKKDAADRPYQAPDYGRGFGVQLFATEKDWWEEAHVLSIQKKYNGHQLLIGTGYTADMVKVTRFILGSFDTREEAARFARRIGKDFPGAFPADLSKLERVERYWPYP